MIQITCKGNSAICTRAARLTSGMVGLQCEFMFDEAWDGLAKTAVFLAGNEKRDVLLQGAVCTVPWEVLKTAGYQLVIGVYGTNAEGTLVIPTVYAMCGGIASGADPSGEESVEPTQTLVEQIMAAAGTAVETANAVKAAADAGDFKGDKGDTGPQGPKGDTGAQGPKGDKGEKGDPGDTPDMTAYRTAEAQDAIDAGKQNTLIQSGASVGQIAKITAVDDTGKPTAWEAVDMPTGSSSEEMRVIKTITITAADVNSIYFNSDDNGLPFALTKHIRIRMYGAATNTGSTQAPLLFRAGQTIGDGSQSEYPIKVNSSNVNYVFDFVWDLYSTINCWYGDFAHARAAASPLQRYVPSEVNNSSDITVREIKLVWSNESVFFQQGATIVVEGI